METSLGGLERLPQKREVRITQAGILSAEALKNLSGTESFKNVDDTEKLLESEEIRKMQSPEGRESWAELVKGIKNGNEQAMERLYKIFDRGIRFYVVKQLGYQEVDDKLHDIFLITINAIRKGELRDPERLMGFVRTVVTRKIAGAINEKVKSRNREVSDFEELSVPVRDLGPEETFLRKEEMKIVEEALTELSDKDREILIRFHLQEQSQEKIMREMKLTETQFRLLKSRAKARFGEIGKRLKKGKRDALKNMIDRDIKAGHIITEVGEAKPVEAGKISGKSKKKAAGA